MDLHMHTHVEGLFPLHMCMHMWRGEFPHFST
mgnify:CR=1 FL=1